MRATELVVSESTFVESKRSPWIGPDRKKREEWEERKHWDGESFEETGG